MKKRCQHVPSTYFLVPAHPWCLGKWPWNDCRSVVVVSVIGEDRYCFRLHRILYDVLQSDHCSWMPTLFAVVCVFANYGACLTLCHLFRVAQKNDYWPLLVRKFPNISQGCVWYVEGVEGSLTMTFLHFLPYLSFSLRIAPFHFLAEGRKGRPNLGFFYLF